MPKIVKLEKRTTLLLKVLLITALAVILVVSFLLWFRKNYKIDRKTDVTVTVIGMSGRYTEEEIREHTLDKWYEQYTPFLKLYYKYNKADTLPFLEKITVKVTGKKSVEIRAYEKMPVGCILEMGNYLYFDSDGVIVSTKKENVENLPVITGLKYTKVTLYQVFETQRSDLARVVMNLVRQLQKHKVEASEIHFGEENEIYLICDGNRFDLGTRDAYDIQIGMIPGILDSIKGDERKFHFHMENVETSEDNVIATVIE
ncbi:MAG: hypothetical protein J5845_01000 [Lachnospiraceae bacterium]|nr:hypothetical protein [Lachnospiraceae bacterium]